MALKITDICNNCGLCEIVCPYEAIYPKKYNWRRIETKYLSFCEDKSFYDDFYSDKHFYIVPLKCTGCRGIYDMPRCIQICPVSAIEYEETNGGDDCSERKQQLDKQHPWRSWT
ncbi:MAG: 4Fe-4S dicluster domain-containing protein [Ignavibacteria bacterium]|nr:4Fe-4S dicluster domain-containing protein [Ignavibacteria bacterium]